MIDQRRHRSRRPGPERPLTSLVVGHTLDEASAHTLGVALDLAQRLRATLHVVHGVSLADFPIDPDSADWDTDVERTLAAERHEVEHTLTGSPCGWTYHSGHGDPVNLLHEIADEESALMIIVGSRGSGWKVALERVLDRSVSRAAVRRGGRPVLVVPLPDET